MNANTFGNARATTRYDVGNLAWFLIPWGILAIIAGIVALAVSVRLARVP